mgnify:FL=1
MEYQVIAKAIKNLKVACLVDQSNYQGSLIDPIKLLEILTEDIAKELDEEEVIKFKDMCEIC